MTTIVGIFDTARDLDRAVDKLARAGFDETVFDEAIVAEDAGRGDPIVFALGHAPAVSWRAAPDAHPKANRSAVIRSFKARLGEYKLPDDVIEGYAITLHHSEFLLVRTEPTRAEQVVSIMRDCGAARADRHD
jgi:hypothetical protein